MPAPRRPVRASTVRAALAALPLMSAAAAALAEAALPAAGPLDGLEFVSVIQVAQYDAPFEDRMVFADGTFFSEECQRRCDFGAQPYTAWREGDTIHFTATLTCADAPQSVSWRGRVTGDRIEGSALWRVERFYWTVEREAIYDGTLVAAPERQAALGRE